MSSMANSARTTFDAHRDSVVTVLMKKRKPSKLCAVGSGFIIRSAEDRCLVLTCRHVFRDFEPSKHAIRTRLCNPDSEQDAELLYQDEIRDLMLIRIVGMPKACPALEFCDARSVPVRSDLILLAYLNTFPNRFNFGQKVVPECVLLMKPGSSPGKTTTPPELAGEVVRHTCSVLEGCRGGPVIFQGRALGVHTGYDSQIGRAISMEGVNAAMKAWLQNAPDVIKTTGEMIQSLPI